MPPPRVMAPPPIPAVVTMPPAPAPATTGAVGRPDALTAVRAPDRLPDTQLSRASQSQSLVGNAATAAALLAAPPGAPSPLGPATVPADPARDARAAAPADPAKDLTAAGTGTAPATDLAAAGTGTAAAARPKAAQDPRFAVLKRDVHAKKRQVAASHPPPKAESVSAQAAARPPTDDKEAQGKVANADKMNEAKPKAFDKAAFVKAVQDAIAQQAPKNLEEADQFADSDKPEQVKEDVRGRVAEGEQDSASDIATTTAAPPDTSKAVTKPVVPMSPDRPPGAPATPDPANAVPAKLPPQATDLSGGPRQVGKEMADAQVTEPQLARSNEPTFTAAVADKRAMEQDSARATPAMRHHEAATLKSATANARHQGATGMHGLAAARVSAGQKVTAGKQGAKGSDEAKRAQVTATLQKVFDDTKRDVEKLLSDLDHMVDRQFSREEKQARDAFTAEHKRKMADYKAKRYSGPLGLLRWGKDKLLGLPKEADQIFTTARDNYITRMRTVISHVADTIGTQLDSAKARILRGRTDLQDAVRKLPADLRAIGQQAAEDFAGRFDELDQQVDDKSNDLVQTLASRYNEALTSVDDEIAKEKEKNKGLVQKAVDAVKGVIKTIMELKNLLLGVLRKAATAIMLILGDPIGFLRNLVGAVGAGLRQFLRNILRHLGAGLLSWLLGIGPRSGLQLPARFDTRGIALLLASLLGMNWPFIRSRLARRVPRQALAAAETAVPIVSTAKRSGAGGLWNDMRGRVGDLKSQLFSKLIAYLVPTVILAGITWVLSLLNPASAFIRACKLIIDIVRFVVERARQIIEFVNAVLDAVIAIARGGAGGAPALVERALARSIPVLIGFLAALLGIGGIAGQVKRIFQALSGPVERALDWVIDRMAGLVRALWARLRARSRPKRPAAPSRPKRPAAARPARPRRPAKPPAKRPRRDRAAPRRPRRQRDPRALDAALREASALVRPGAAIEDIRRRLPEIRRRHGLTSLELVVDGEAGAATLLHFEAVINPRKRGRRLELTLARQEIQETYGILVAHQARFQTFANEGGLVIDVRATNPYSAPWIEEGAIPKPAQVKAKTLQPEDMLVGGPPGDLGLVGFFQPTPGPPPGAPMHRAGSKRFAERQKEYGKYYGDMQDLRPPPATKGRYEVVNKVVWGFTEKGEMRPLAGDNDLFAIRYIKDDQLVRGHPYRELINEMIEADIGVRHGATVNWNPPERDMVELRIQVIKKARREKIIRFRPHLPPRLVGFRTPVQRVDRAR